MRAFVITILMVSVIAINAEAPSKKLEKRGILSGHGYSSGGLSSGAYTGSLGLAPSGSYLPPVSSLPVIKKPYPVSLPVPSYNVGSYAPAVPAPTYGVPSLAPAPAFATSVVSSAPSVGVHGQVPVYTEHVSAPVSTYGTPSYAPSTSYGVPAPVGPVTLGTGSLSTSHGVPSTVVDTVPSFGASFPSGGYGVPSSVVGGGYSAGHLGVHGGGYSAPTVFQGGHATDLSVSLPATSYGVPSHGVQLGHSEGYSYPAPANKLLI